MGGCLQKDQRLIDGETPDHRSLQESHTHWHLHELRHSFASLMLAQGVRLEEESELIGHASIRVTKDVYGHLSGERLREASDKLGEFLGDL
ncbi:MAG: tyrosine-type recombinase/integrase [Ferrimicrobium sp.]